MMRMSKWLCCLLTLAMVLGVMPLTMAESEEITLKFFLGSSWETSDTKAVMDEKLESEFFSQHPNVKIEYEYVPFSDMETKVITSYAGGVYYDLMQVNHPAVAQFVQAGVLRPLDEYLQKDGIDFKSYFNASIAEAGMVNDTVYTLPYDTDTRVLAVNKKLFEENNIEYPTTKDEMLAAAQALTQDTDGDGINDQFGLIFEASQRYHPTYELGQYLLGNGVKVFSQNEDGSYQSNLDTPAALDFMQWSLEMSKCQPNDFISYDGDKIVSMFAQGKTGMFIFGSWNLSNKILQEAVETNGLEYELIINPAGLIKSGASMGGWQWGISAQTPNADICWEVLSMLNRADVNAAMTGIGGNLTPILDGYNYPPFNEPLYEVIAKQLLTAEVPVPQITVTNEIVTEVWYNAWLAAMLGDMSCEEALAQAHDEITMILAEYMAER